MTVNRPCYVTREMVMRAADFNFGVRSVDAVDRAIESASDNIDGTLMRRFYNAIETNYWDWPNFQYAYPWRIWFDSKELADKDNYPPVVKTGSQVIPNSAIFFGPWYASPPYTFMELDRSQNYTFGAGSTPQRDVSIQGMFGFWNRTKNAGKLGASLDNSSTTIQVSSDAVPGVGDVITAGSEMMLVQDRNWVDTGITQQGTGVSTAQAADNVLAVPDGTQFSNGEVLLLDEERMFVYQIIGNNLTVKRAFDGTVLDTHSNAHIYSGRLLTVTRGDFGSAAATHTSGSALVATLIPALIRDLALAEAAVQASQEVGTYSDPSGESGATVSGLGATLSDKWEEAEMRYGRQMRSRVV